MNKLNKLYIGYSESPNFGDFCDVGRKGLIPFSESAMCEANYPKKTVGWNMTPERLYILFDFTADTFIDSISVSMKTVLPEEEKYFGQGQMEVIYRAEGGQYFTADKLYPVCNKREFTISVAKKARFVQLKINRSPWRQYPLPKVTFYGEECVGELSPISDELMYSEFGKEATGTDKYGQATFVEWDGKITDDDMLLKNREEEAHLLETYIPDGKYDIYGGIKGYKHLEATGFFRTEKVDGTWWFVTPLGNPFLMKGVDLITYLEASMQTPIYIKDTKTVRSVFEELPDKNETPDAYEICQYGYEAVNFLRANLIRKYGPNYDEEWVKVTEKRLASWGFNASSKWLKHDGIKIPYIKSLGAGTYFKSVRWLIDPYASDFEENVEKSVKGILAELRDDPYLIGYHYTNEKGFDKEIFREMLSLGSECDMKKCFVQYLKEHISESEISQYFDIENVSFENLVDTPLVIDKLSEEIINGFITATAKIYYKTIRDVIKRNDPNHLFLGTSVVPEWHSTYAWDIGGLEYLDVLSFDQYCRTDDKWFDRYAKFDIPMINFEFSFTASDRGLSPIFERIHCENQSERGKEYKKFLEYYFSYPQFIGSGFFILYDEPFGGRCNPDGSGGECHNFGLIDVTDQPYYDFIKYVKETHERIENIHSKGDILKK